MRNYDEVCARILILSQQVWEDRVKQPDIDVWLENFDGSSGIVEDEHENALHLLAHFNHFGLREIRVLLRALYRDHLRYPIIQDIRRAHSNTRDRSLIDREYATELASTRFVGMGNPSESGSHLLYYFRQENNIGKDLFVHPHQLMDRPAGDPLVKLTEPGLKRIIFIDDVLGSGQQSMEYSRILLPSLRTAARNSGSALELIYAVLFAKPEGLAIARSTSSMFDSVRAVHELDQSECAFTSNSRVYAAPVTGVSLTSGRQMAMYYGRKLQPFDPLGYRNGQMLLGLHHNVPDNTLPIFWSDRPGQDWKPIFTRHAKV